MRPTAGLTFGGRYELQSRIAIGGMGEVWQATDLVIGRTVAIKILKDEYLGDPGFLERFRAEARHAALVNHEGIANVFDYGEEEGSAYLVMELVPGEPLSTVLERDHTLSADRVLDIVAQTAAALHAAHAAGLVHRDIKPGNLLITPDGRVKITDFGIARIADQVPITATGQVMGTVQYLSPEQASGHPASPTTDVYSLGIVAYECLAGKRPFTGESQVAIAMAQINDAPPALPVTISEPVRNLVFSCIAKDPAERPASAAHLSRAAQALRRGDVAAATTAVPAVLGGENGEGATRLLPTAGATEATTILAASSGEPDTATSSTTTKKRSPWTWPLIALIALLLIVLIGTLVALFVRPGGGPVPSGSSGTPTHHSSSPPPTTSSPPPTTPASRRVEIDADDYKGKTGDEASALLTKKGMVANVVEGKAATSQDQAGKVYQVNPTGPVIKGKTITLTTYGPMATPSAPPNAPSFASSVPPASGSNHTVQPGAQVTVNFQQGNCPTGQQLHGYQLYVNGDSAGMPLGASATSGTVTAPGSDFAVTYSIFCGDGSVESGQSPALDIPVDQGGGGNP